MISTYLRPNAANYTYMIFIKGLSLSTFGHFEGRFLLYHISFGIKTAPFLHGTGKAMDDLQSSGYSVLKITFFRKCKDLFGHTQYKEDVQVCLARIRDDACKDGS